MSRSATQPNERTADRGKGIRPALKIGLLCMFIFDENNLFL